MKRDFLRESASQAAFRFSSDAYMGYARRENLKTTTLDGKKTSPLNQKSLKNDYHFCKIFLDILHDMRYSAGNIWMNLQYSFAAAVCFTEGSDLDGSN